MNLRFQPMDEASAQAILVWHYDPPYDVYDPGGDKTEEAMRSFLTPQNGYYCIVDAGGDLVAYCCFGPDAQVGGGDYSTPALDIGLGVRPDLTGRQRGRLFVEAVLAFAQSTFAPPRFRVTVAEFNQRAHRVWEKAGFVPVQTFNRSPDGMRFVLREKPGLAPCRSLARPSDVAGSGTAPAIRQLAGEYAIILPCAAGMMYSPAQAV